MLNLVYDSMFLLREQCSTLCSLVDGLFIYGYIFLRFDVHSG